MTMTYTQRFRAALAAYQAGQLPQAEQLCREALRMEPNYPDAHHLLALLRSHAGDYDAAVDHLRQGLAQQPHNPLFHNSLGEVRRRQGMLDQALASYRQALTLAPNFAEAHYNLANVLKQCGQVAEAIAHYQRAVELKPGYAKAHYNLGNIWLEQGSLEAAATAFQRAIVLMPRSAEAHNNLGVVLREQERPDEAIAAYRQAIRVNPAFAEAHRNLGLALARRGRIAEARASLHVALELEPDNDLFRLAVDVLCPVIPASVEQIALYRAELADTIQRYMQRGLRVDLARAHLSGGEPPFALAYQGGDDRAIKESYAALFRDSFPDFSHPVGLGKPHIGVVVTHGHEGVFLKCFRGILNHLDGDRFRLTVVCGWRSGEQILRRGINNPNVRYLPLPPRVDQAIAAVAQARFDLLHYWEVGTDVTNYCLPFCRLAPVQSTTWGWPVTTGIPEMDYFVSSALLETDSSDAHYTEHLVRLARLPTYYYRPSPGNPRWSRADVGLAEGQHVYLCAQNLRKAHPEFDLLVAAILRRDPQAVVCFIADAEPHLSTLLRRRFEQVMPDVMSRVRFLPRLGELEYLSLIRQSDVVLDTLHYGGGANTTYDAFAVGAPVVTLPTQFHRGRYAYAAYHQIGVLDAIAADADDYVAIAVRLGSDPAYRAELSGRIMVAGRLLFEDMAAVTELAGFWERAVERARGVSQHGQG